MDPAQELAEEFADALKELKGNDFIIIRNLTTIADENKGFATVIAAEIEKAILQAPPSLKLVYLYVLDSIAKTVKGYIPVFSEKIVNLFIASYRTNEADPEILKKLRQLASTWSAYFSETINLQIKTFLGNPLQIPTVGTINPANVPVARQPIIPSSTIVTAATPTTTATIATAAPNRAEVRGNVGYSYENDSVSDTLIVVPRHPIVEPEVVNVVVNQPPSISSSVAAANEEFRRRQRAEHHPKHHDIYMMHNIHDRHLHPEQHDRRDHHERYDHRNGKPHGIFDGVDHHHHVPLTHHLPSRPKHVSDSGRPLNRYEMRDKRNSPYDENRGFSHYGNERPYVGPDTLIPVNTAFVEPFPQHHTYYAPPHPQPSPFYPPPSTPLIPTTHMIPAPQPQISTQNKIILSLSDPNSLKQDVSSTQLQNIYIKTSNQCSFCGVRFINHDKLEHHYTIHPAHKIKQNANSVVPLKSSKISNLNPDSRPWFWPSATWITEKLNHLPINEKAIIEQEKKSLIIKNEIMEAINDSKPVVEQTVSEDDSRSKCSYCNEDFERVWSDTLEEWRFRSATELEGHYFHVKCAQLVQLDASLTENGNENQSPSPKIIQQKQPKIKFIENMPPNAWHLQNNEVSKKNQEEIIPSVVKQEKVTKFETNLTLSPPSSYSSSNGISKIELNEVDSLKRSFAALNDSNNNNSNNDNNNNNDSNNNFGFNSTDQTSDVNILNPKKKRQRY